MASTTTEARFWAKVSRGSEDECWPWTACTQKNGYGRFGWAAGDVRMAHRVAYELTFGDIPEGEQIDHVKTRGCVRKDCCNPHHLEPVKQRENLLRADGWAGKNSRVTECPRGHAYTEENTLWHHGRRECRQCDRDRSRARYHRKHNKEHA